MKSIFFSVALILFISSAVYGDLVWEDVTSGIDAEEFYEVSTSSQKKDVAYTATSGGVYRTEDGGLSWQNCLYLNAGGAKAFSVAIDPENSNIIYTATDKGLYKSKDNGRSWNRIFTGRGSAKSINCVTIDESNVDVVYAGTQSGLFRSMNRGKSWLKAEGLLSKLNVYQILVHPAKNSLIYSVTDRGLFKSEDGGVVWEAVFTHFNNREDDVASSGYDEEAEVFLPRVRSVAINSFDLNHIYLATEEGVFQSRDRGGTWTQFNSQGLISKDVNFIFTAKTVPCRIYAATKNGVFLFSENDEWISLSPQAGPGNALFITRSSGDDPSLWVTADNGVYKTAPQEAIAIARMEAHKLLTDFSNEPSAREIQERAIKYAEVHPEKIAGWRRAAKGRAFLPKLSLGIDKSVSDTYEIYTSASRQYYIFGPDDETTGWDVSLTWDLANLVWNDDQTQIDVRSKLMVQLRDDVLDEVTRYYFERRKLQIELVQSAPQNTRQRIQKELRLQELTANIDALTGGHLSDCLKQ